MAARSRSPIEARAYGTTRSRATASGSKRGRAHGDARVPARGARLFPGASDRYPAWALDQPPEEPWVVLITHPPEGAEAFAQRLVEDGLAACVNLLPATSVYRWEGEVRSEHEVLLVAKTTSARRVDLERCVRSYHPFEVPELVALPTAFVEARYAAWLTGAVNGTSAGDQRGG